MWSENGFELFILLIYLIHPTVLSTAEWSSDPRGKINEVPEFHLGLGLIKWWVTTTKNLRTILSPFPERRGDPWNSGVLTYMKQISSGLFAWVVSKESKDSTSSWLVLPLQARRCYAYDPILALVIDCRQQVVLWQMAHSTDQNIFFFSTSTFMTLF